MLTAINAWTFPAELSPEQQLTAAAAAGFEGIELTIATDGPLRFDTPLEACAELAHRAADLKLRIVSLATGEFWQTNYADPDEVVRQRAVDLTLHMLDRAVALEAEAILVVPAVVGTLDEPRPRVSYADALSRAFDTLRGLRHEAESRGVTIALENVLNRFLLSPFEAAELLDRINSAYVGWYFDTGNVMPLGYPEDWIAILGGRIKRVHVKDYDLTRPRKAGFRGSMTLPAGFGAGPVASVPHGGRRVAKDFHIPRPPRGADATYPGFCPLGEGSIDWPRVIAALREIGYDGPLTFEGPGDPAEIHRRLGNIINDRPVLQKDESK